MGLTATAPAEDLVPRLEEHRAALTSQCRWMLGSASEADDAVQETMVRAWQAIDEFAGRGSLLSWLRRIARNVCLDMVKARQRRARPYDGDGWDAPWLEPVAARAPCPADEDPADRAVASDEVRRAFVATLLHLSPRERSALLLCEVLRWRASEAAELLGTSVASVTSALQRARTALPDRAGGGDAALALDDQRRARLHGYVDAFERDDMRSLVSLLRHHEGAGAVSPRDC